MWLWVSENLLSEVFGEDVLVDEGGDEAEDGGNDADDLEE